MNAKAILAWIADRLDPPLPPTSWDDPNKPWRQYAPKSPTRSPLSAPGKAPPPKPSSRLRIVCAAFALLVSPAAHADPINDLFCSVVDQQGNRITYELANDGNGGPFTEVAFQKNDQVITSSGTPPVWTGNPNEGGGFAIHSTRDPDWFLSLDKGDVTNGIKHWSVALVFKQQRVIARGECNRHAVFQGSGPPTGPSAGPTSVALRSTTDGSAGQIVRVWLGAHWADMILDTGATIGNVPLNRAQWLVQNGDATWGKNATLTLADGSSHEQNTVIFASVTIGGRTIHNVTMAVGPSEGEALLGMNVLKMFGKFTIDTEHGVLILG